MTNPRCRNCKKTEQECAYSYPCCAEGRACSHWRNWTADGEPIPKSTAAGGRPLAPVIDAVTAKRREQWRSRYRKPCVVSGPQLSADGSFCTCAASDSLQDKEEQV